MTPLSRPAVATSTVAAVLLGAALLAPAASARTTPVPTGDDDVTTAGGVLCAFPVTIATVRGGQVSVDTTAADGTVTTRSSGPLVQRVTNLATGRSATYDVSGPSTAVTTADGSRTTVAARGRTLTFAGPRSRAASGLRTGVLVTTDTTSLTVIDGLVTSFSTTGRRTDVCAALS